ncbi:MAG: radical SAM family heme chaperone HemW [Actinobacteria bacterium]|nr:radical SAM family heme chaperone HemW [Actinomycetota bacterium]
MSGVRHLYVHLPFCAHRCGYCDFVTAVGRRDQHAGYVEALLGELELERHLLAPRLETVFVGGGTPTYTEPRALAHLLGALPSAAEVTVEANPETVTSELATLLAEGGVTRVSLGVQSFAPHLLRTLERRAEPDDVRRAVSILRIAGFDNISLDLICGIPGQSPAELDRDLAEALALEPEHLSCYELEAKPGTRFTFAHGAALTLQADAIEGYFERVVDSLQGAGYRWYETSNFCRPAGRDASRRDLRSRHNLAYWLGRDYLGLGMGAVSTVRGRRWRNTPRLSAYLAAASRVQPPDRELEQLDGPVRLRERLLLGLRLDEPLDVSKLDSAIDRPALERLEKLGLAERAGTSHLRLTRRGRFLGGGVTADLLS